MVQTIKQFLDEIRMIRKDMYLRGERADTLLVASWLDRLVISLEKVAPTLDLMSEELDQLAKADMAKPKKKTKKVAKKKPKKASRKKARKPKKAKKKRRR